MSDSYRFGGHSGGCQCGAVRFHATELRDNPHICFCRMCQKATGNIFAALVGVETMHLTWTRSTPATFRSSEHVDRGFCAACGTSLFYRYVLGTSVALSIGAFDAPHRIPILFQSGLEGRHPSFPLLPGVKATGTTEDADGSEAVADIAATNRQHPDHDTATWPLRAS